MRVAVHCSWVLALLLAAPAQAQQATGSPATSYTLFIRGAAAGSETITVATAPAGTTITSEGRFSAPLNITLRSAEIRYTPDWTPTLFTAEGAFNGVEAAIRTTFENGTAVTRGTEGGQPISETHPLESNVVVLPNAVFAGYAALAKRLATDLPGTALRAFIPPAVEIPIRVTAVHNEQTQVGTIVFAVRRYELVFAQPAGDLAVTLTTTTDGELVRLTVGAQALELVRSDVASPTSRSEVYSNPGDEPVVIPLEGFNLGATLTRPRAATAARLPAVILLATADANDRDGVTAGVPILGQLAGALADAGFLAVRYDKRGFGQSGGRAESATVSDQADDARAVAKWLASRKDVDNRRIAIVGHGEGAMVAVLAAARDRRFTAVVSIAGPATTGAEQFLERQELAAAQSNLPPAEREARLALQRRVQEAVLTGKGWDDIPPQMRREADTPWFQSLLAYDPARVLDDLRQPLLIVHGALDREVPVTHADRLAALARQESKSKSIDVVIVRGVNHLLVPAVSGSTSEYGTLTDRTVSRDVAAAVTGWLTRTLAAAR